MKAALKEIGDLGCRIFVAGRLDEGTFRELGDVGVPPEHTHLFEAISEGRLSRRHLFHRVAQKLVTALL